MLKKNDVVQFNENHKWSGCFGFISEIKDCGDNGIRYMVGVPVPMQGTAYIFVMNTENAIEKIGEAILVLEDDE
jgi:hypothetical protein